MGAGLVDTKRVLINNGKIKKIIRNRPVVVGPEMADADP